MVRSLYSITAFVFVLATTAVQQAVESRLLPPLRLELQALKLRRNTEVDLAAQIESYFAGSGFPKQGRTLQQKIDETDAFLNQQLAKANVVGVSTAVVYKDQVVYAKGYGVRRFSDPAAVVTADDMFQIGSVSKTHIALGVGLLVDDGKIAWKDPVKKHIPWLKLFDKYAEEHVRIGDLLSMNSGLGRSQDPALDAGAYHSQRSFIQGLEFAEPDFPLRDTPAYANANYEILGQLIEEVSGEPWAQFLNERLWKPLNMTRTFGAIEDVPPELQAAAVNAGHFICESNVRGPLSMYNNPATNLTIGYKHQASGSIVSSANDMTKLLRLVLNKGTVDGVKLFQSPDTITQMITGKNKAINELTTNPSFLPRLGYEFRPNGNSLSAGYGFDVVGNVMWGHAYVDKGGDTFVHHTTTGYVPNDELALAMLVNSEGSTTALTDQLRSYVLGIFLDVPKAVLDFQYAKWQTQVPPQQAPFPGAPACGFAFWKNPPHLAISPAVRDQLVGVYQATTSSQFNPQLTITQGETASELRLEVGRINLTTIYIGDMDSAMYFLPQSDRAIFLGAVTAVPDEATQGGFLLEISGLIYRQQ